MRHIKPKITAYILLFFFLHTFFSPTHSHPNGNDEIIKAANEIIKTINNLLTYRKSCFIEKNLNHLNSQKELSEKIIKTLNANNETSSDTDTENLFLFCENQRKNLEEVLNVVEQEPEGDALMAGVIYTYPSYIKGKNNPIWNFFQLGYRALTNTPPK